MNWFVLLILFHRTLAWYHYHHSRICGDDHKTKEYVGEKKLMHDWQNCGDLYDPPLIIRNGAERLRVRLAFFVRTFTYNTKRQEFSGATSIILSWKDERSSWDPNKYNGVKTVVASPMRMWKPEVKLHNYVGDDFNSGMKYMYIPCEIESSGQISCEIEIHSKVKCKTDIREWPYDSQYCKMEFGPYLGMETKIQFDISTYRAMEVFPKGQWKIEDYEQILDADSKTPVTFKFRLERHTQGLTGIVIYPSVVLSTLTFCCLFIDARLEYRVFMMCFSLLCHFYFITDFTWEFPDNTRDSPKILLYYRGSLIITIVFIVLSFILHRICEKATNCPKFITSVNEFVYGSVFRLAIYPRWESKTAEDTEYDFSKQWTEFANVINSVFIYIAIVFYVILYCVFMPQPNSFA